MSSHPTIVIPAPVMGPFGVPIDASGLIAAWDALDDTIGQSVEGRILRGALRSVIAGVDPGWAAYEPQYEYAVAHQDTKTLEIEQHTISRWDDRAVADMWVELDKPFDTEGIRTVILRRVKQVSEPEIVS